METVEIAEALTVCLLDDSVALQQSSQLVGGHPIHIAHHPGTDGHPRRTQRTQDGWDKTLQERGFPPTNSEMGKEYYTCTDIPAKCLKTHLCLHFAIFIWLPPFEVAVNDNPDCNDVDVSVVGMIETAIQYIIWIPGESKVLRVRLLPFTKLIVQVDLVMFIRSAFIRKH